VALTQTKVLARSLAAFIFCGGNKEAAKALLFVRALFLARLPRTPTRLARARLVLHVIYIDRSSVSRHVSKIQERIYLARHERSVHQRKIAVALHHFFKAQVLM
jgi:DNA-binding MarR family transcriptional regulator